MQMDLLRIYLQITIMAVLDRSGDPFDIESSSLAASNGYLKDPLVQVLNEGHLER